MVRSTLDRTRVNSTRSTQRSAHSASSLALPSPAHVTSAPTNGPGDDTDQQPAAAGSASDQGRRLADPTSAPTDGPEGDTDQQPAAAGSAGDPGRRLADPTSAPTDGPGGETNQNGVHR